MSFASDLNTIINADASINSWCNGGVYFENLPDNFDLTKTWLGYSFRKNEQTDCLTSKNAFTTYGITLKVIATDTLELEYISDYITDYMNGKTQGSIRDIWFLNDTHSMDIEKGIYMNTLEFSSFYS